MKRRKVESTQKVPIFYIFIFFHFFSLDKYFCIQQEGRRADAMLDKKERSSKGKARDEQKELRREKKQGRKRVMMFLLFNYRVRSLHIHIYTVKKYIKLLTKQPIDQLIGSGRGIHSNY